MPSQEFNYKSNLTHNKAIRVSVPDGWEIVSKIPVAVEHGMRYIARRDGNNFGGLAAEQRPAHSIMEGRRFIIRPTVGGVEAERLANGEPSLAMTSAMIAEQIRGRTSSRTVSFDPGRVSVDMPSFIRPVATLRRPEPETPPQPTVVSVDESWSESYGESTQNGSH